MIDNRPAVPRPLILTLGLDAGSFAWLDALRTEHFPPERNVIPAHLTLFHALPGDHLDRIEAEVEQMARSTAPPPLHFVEPFRLSGGFAIRVESPSLLRLRETLARAFVSWLTPQDRQPYRRPHVTLMNKADRNHAARAFEQFRSSFEHRAGTAESLRLWAYLGGPWRAVNRFAFGESNLANP